MHAISPAEIEYCWTNYLDTEPPLCLQHPSSTLQRLFQLRPDHRMWRIH